MKRSPFLQSIAMAGFLMLFLSCHKRGDFEVPCKILQITEHYRFYPDEPVQTTKAFFEYNAWGDPSDITWDNPGTGKPHYKFIYDKKRRLTRFIGYHSANNFEFYNKYIYGANNMIVADTSWYSGGDTSRPNETSQGYTLNYYTYDSKGRVVKIDSKAGGLPLTHTYHYEYDAKGNLIDVGRVYDNKTHYLRTNLVLMFINRDYSVNNSAIADSYNNKGLPLIVSGRELRFMNAAVNEAVYSCGHNH